MKKIFQYIAMAVAVVAMASCSQEEMFEPVAPQGMRFIVSEFPAYGDMQTRAIGTQDAGKTAWADNDKLLLSITFKSGKKQGYTLEYQSGKWILNDKVLAGSDITEVLAVYAPDCEIKSDGSIGLVSDKLYGMAEYIPATTSFDGFNVSISFTDVTRTYSRLRIVAMSDQQLDVATDGFTPAGATKVATAAYTLTADENGNAFLYGTFAKGARVTVTTTIVRNEQASVKTIADYTFTAENYPNGTVKNTSYALDARNGYEIESSADGVTTYKVYDADGLLAWNEAARDNGSTNLALMKDIDMSDAGKWTPVGDYYYPYAGTIDGNNHTISNITLSDLTDDEWYVYVGFVGYMARDGVSEMKDITFDSPKISMTKSYSESYSVYVGIVGYMNYESTMTNVSVTGETAWLVQNGDCQGLCYIGGIAGLNLGGSISGCTSGANIRDLSDANSERYVGGIAGQCSSSGKINGCVFYGYLLASSNSVYSGIGGIVGYIQSSQDEIVGCYVTGTVTAGEGNEASVGTIAGYLSPTTDASAVKSCYWSGNDDLTAFGDCTEVDGTDVTWELAMVQMNDALDVAGAGVKYESSTENEKLPLVPVLKNRL